MSTQINLTDIIDVVALIDIVASRGAFRGEELLAIGTIRDKFSKFVDENTPKTDEVEAQSE